VRRGLVVLCLLSSCTGTGNVDPTPRPDPLLDIARRDGAVVVIAQLAVPPKPDGSWSGAAVARAQRELVRSIGSGARVVERFGRKLPQITLLVDEESLMELRQSPQVVNISLNEPDEPTE
jgi:hypothetical protein